MKNIKCKSEKQAASSFYILHFALYIVSFLLSALSFLLCCPHHRSHVTKSQNPPTIPTIIQASRFGLRS